MPADTHDTGCPGITRTRFEHFIRVEVDVRVLAKRHPSASGVAGRRRVWRNGDRRTLVVPVEVDRRISPDRRLTDDRRSGYDRRGSLNSGILSLPTFSGAETERIQELMATPGARIGCPSCNGVLTLGGPLFRDSQRVWIVRCAGCKRSVSVTDIYLVPGTA